jgi:hypothetical protein
MDGGVDLPASFQVAKILIGSRLYSSCIMLKNKIFYVLVLFIPLYVGCGGSDPVQAPPEAPRVMNFKADPNVICVGGASNITFDLIDPNQDVINWNLKLSSTIHGTLDKTSGTDASGSHLSVRFKAATSGRHRHRIAATVSATDPGGLPAQDVSIDLYVFNCG